ncbi:MAG: hypothetical protein GY839_11770 [candidate division Zixibacteria bacterium]|nr:hypothetical protein [candidate division Zixibacteria bacterium]
MMSRDITYFSSRSKSKRMLLATFILSLFLFQSAPAQQEIEIDELFMMTFEEAFPNLAGTEIPKDIE